MWSQGLFDKIAGLRRESETSLGPAKAFAAIALIAVAADGHISDTEALRINNFYTRSSQT